MSSEQTELLAEPPQVGELAPDCTLPDGTALESWRGRPVVLAFAPPQWDPRQTYQTEIFAQLAQEFGIGEPFAHEAEHGWITLDTDGPVAESFGVPGKRAIFILDEEGVVRWSLIMNDGEPVRTGDVIQALEDFHTQSRGHGGLSRRTFLCALLAAAAVLTLPPALSEAAHDNNSHLKNLGRPEPRPTYDLDGTIPITLRINGKLRQLHLETRVTLLDALREYLHLTGTKKGCDHGQCGACTVHINGQRTLSCLNLAVMSQGKDIITIEGLSDGQALHPVQAAFIKHDAFQCGYCTPGQIMSAVALLKEGSARSDIEIRESMSGNLCRCSAYPNIIAAIQEARGS